MESNITEGSVANCLMCRSGTDVYNTPEILADNLALYITKLLIHGFCEECKSRIREDINRGKYG